MTDNVKRLKLKANREAISVKLHPFTLALLKGISELTGQKRNRIIERAIWEISFNPVTTLLEPHIPGLAKAINVRAEDIPKNSIIYSKVAELEMHGLDLGSFLRGIGVDKSVSSVRRLINKITAMAKKKEL